MNERNKKKPSLGKSQVSAGSGDAEGQAGLHAGRRAGLGGWAGAALLPACGESRVGYVPCPAPPSGCKRSEALGHHLKAGEQREATQEPPGSPSPPKASLQSAGTRHKMYMRENSNASRSPRGESNRRKGENGALTHRDRDRPSEEALRRHLVAAVGTAAPLEAEAWAGRRRRGGSRRRTQMAGGRQMIDRQTGRCRW